MESRFFGLEAGQVVVLLLTAIACWCDLRTRRIPNLVTFGGAAAGLLWGLASHGLSGAANAAGGWLTGIGIFLPFFLLGGMGAGDIKLVGCIGAWLGPRAALWVALYAALAGGVLAIAIAVATGYFRQSVTNIVKLLAYWRIVGVRPLREVTLEGGRGPRLPYALPIAIGAVVVIWFR
jgi:prepilin peptidase CpaA